MGEHWTIVGVGNLHRGDDAAGPTVAARFAGTPGVRVVINHGDPFAMVDVLAGSHAVVIVDATRGAGAPGTLTVIEAAGNRLPVRVGASSHGFGAAAVLELADALGTIPDRVVFVGIEGEDFDGAALSPRVAAALDDALAAVAGVIDGA